MPKQNSSKPANDWLHRISYCKAVDTYVAASLESNNISSFRKYGKEESSECNKIKFAWIFGMYKSYVLLNEICDHISEHFIYYKWIILCLVAQKYWEDFSAHVCLWLRFWPRMILFFWSQFDMNKFFSCLAEFPSRNISYRPACNIFVSFYMRVYLLQLEYSVDYFNGLKSKFFARFFILSFPFLFVYKCFKYDNCIVLNLYVHNCTFLL